MPGSSTLQRGNELFAMILFVTVTPPASVVTATQTVGTATINGLQIGDLMSWNLTTASGSTNYNALLLIEGMYVSSANTLTISWSTTGATISGAGPQTILLEATRPENYPVTGLAGLPGSIV
jgi:hypothetical protein